MLIQFTLIDLLELIVFIIGITIGVLLISVLWNVKKLISVVRPLIENGKECFIKTTKAMPEIIDNIEKISGNVKVTTDKMKTSLPVILDEVECLAGEAKESIMLVGDVIENIGSGINDTVEEFKSEKSDFMPYLRIFEEVVQIIYRTFSSGK